jgi:hypothetical protein
VVDDAGHGPRDSGIAGALLAAIDRFASARV